VAPEPPVPLEEADVPPPVPELAVALVSIPLEVSEEGSEQAAPAAPSNPTTASPARGTSTADERKLPKCSRVVIAKPFSNGREHEDLTVASTPDVARLREGGRDAALRAGRLHATDVIQDADFLPKALAAATPILAPATPRRLRFAEK
jgi:hypothetical protein